jgi:hypothetical protein
LESLLTAIGKMIKLAQLVEGFEMEPSEAELRGRGTRRPEHRKQLNRSWAGKAHKAFEIMRKAKEASQWGKGRVWEAAEEARPRRPAAWEPSGRLWSCQATLVRMGHNEDFLFKSSGTGRAERLYGRLEPGMDGGHRVPLNKGDPLTLLRDLGERRPTTQESRVGICLLPLPQEGEVGFRPTMCAMSWFAAC